MASTYRPCRSIVSACATAKIGESTPASEARSHHFRTRGEPRSLEQFVERKTHQILELRRGADTSDQVERGVPFASARYVGQTDSASVARRNKTELRAAFLEEGPSERVEVETTVALDEQPDIQSRSAH